MENFLQLFSDIKNGDSLKVKSSIESSPTWLNKFIYGVTPLMYAIECGNEEISLELCQNPNADFTLTDNFDMSYLQKAVEAKLPKLVELLLSKIKRSNLNDMFIDNETLLTYSIKMNDPNTSLAFINDGSSLNFANKLNEYPLQLAVKFNKMDLVRSMLKQSDHLNLNTYENNFNPLLYACANDETELACLFSDVSGVDLNAIDEEQNWPPLMHAIYNNNETLIAKLLEKQCRLDTVDVNGDSPLHLAVYNENDFVVKLLLKFNASKSVRNNDLQTPLDIAKVNESEDLIPLLS